MYLWVSRLLGNQINNSRLPDTAEVEYVAAVHATKTALWLAQMLAEMLSTSVPRIHLLEDNQACISMAENPEISARNRHFAMRMWWLRDMVTNKQLSFTQVPTEHQLADIFTKVLAKPRFFVSQRYNSVRQDTCSPLILSQSGGGCQMTFGAQSLLQTNTGSTHNRNTNRSSVIGPTLCYHPLGDSTVTSWCLSSTFPGPRLKMTISDR